MSTIKGIVVVMVPVADQNRATAFYCEQLGFDKTADIPFGDGDRWIELTPPGGGPAIAPTPAREGWEPGRMTGVSLHSSDPHAEHARLKEAGVDVDDEVMVIDGPPPDMFFLRDADGNTLLIVEDRER